MIKLKLLIIVVILTVKIRAQESILDLPLSISYYGENGIHPGLKIGTSYTFWTKKKSKIYRLNKRQNKYGNKTKLKELNLDFNFGMYSFPNNHTGYFTTIGTTFLRKKLRKQRQLGVSFEIGYLRRQNKLKTYKLNENGGFETVNGAGTNSLIFSLSPILAKEFIFMQKTIRFFIKPNMQMVKYNEKLQPNVTLEIGLVLNINREN